MNTQSKIIGWTIAIGNPREGFALWGFFADQYQASDSASTDKTIEGDWWILPVYEQDDNQ